MTQTIQKNSDAKREIFAAIRRSLAQSAPFDSLHHAHHAPQQSAVSLIQEKSFIENASIISVSLPEETLAESFQSNLQSIGGKCTIVKSETEAVAQIQEIIETNSAKRIAISDSGLVKQIRGALKSASDFLQNASKEELFDCDLGITSAQYGIAETGTLILETDREFSRLTSLVPPIHVCLLEAVNVRQTLGEVLQTLNSNGGEKLSRTITFVTGPSRTSDIELTLAIGVHGPAQLYVIVIDEN